MSALPAMFAASGPPAPLAVEDVNNPAFQPFQKQVQLTWVIGVTDTLVSFPVPAGKRLVIEFVSIACILPIGQNPTTILFRLNDDGHFGYVEHFFFTPLQGNVSVGSNFNVFVCSTPTRLYCDPGSSVQVQAGRNSTVESGTVKVSISGYYVNVP